MRCKVADPRVVVSCAFVLCCLGSPAAHAQSLSIPNTTVAKGATGANIFVHASHAAFALTGFSVSIRYTPAQLVVTAVTTAGTSVGALPDPVAFLNGSFNQTTGAIAYGCVLDLNHPLTNFLPAGGDSTLLRITVDVPLAAGATTALTFVNGLGDFPINNVLVDDQGTSIPPAFVSGTILAEQIFLRGDIDGDGVVGIADPIRLLLHLFAARPRPACDDASDANDDGLVDVADPVRILFAMFGGTVSISSPGPFSCGIDPTLDTLAACPDRICP